MTWQISNRCDPRGKRIADRHYSRQTPESEQFVKPGRCLVLWQQDALWVTSWPYSEHVKHAWAGAWECSLFRNEGAGLSSDLITEAVAATRWKYGIPPDEGFVTFVDSSEVRDGEPGYCFRCAGWERDGYTEGGLHVWHLPPCEMPDPKAPVGATQNLSYA
jgi:hypothetical protein